LELWGRNLQKAGGRCIVWSFVVVLRTRNCLGVQIKEDDMSGCVARVEEKRNACRFSVGGT
jgi:hypothetical protein